MDSIRIQHVEFLSQDKSVVISPLERISAVKLIGGTYGPFYPRKEESVPLWLAIILKKKLKCNIVPPEWLTVRSLQVARDSERTTEKLCELGFHFFPIAYQLLSVAPDGNITQRNTTYTYFYVLLHLFVIVLFYLI